MFVLNPTDIHEGPWDVCVEVSDGAAEKEAKGVEDTHVRENTLARQTSF